MSDPGDEPDPPDDSAWLNERIPTPVYRPPIFLSYPTPVAAEQMRMVKAIYGLLARRTLTPRTLGVNAYDFEAPLRAIRTLINQSQGLFAIALRKSEIKEGHTRRRNGHHQVEDRLDLRSMTSPWIQIEAAMAFQLDLPMLIIREKGVIADGLLEDGVIVHHMLEFDVAQDPKVFLRTDAFAAALDAWATRVRQGALGWNVLRDHL